VGSVGGLGAEGILCELEGGEFCVVRGGGVIGGGLGARVGEERHVEIIVYYEYAP